MFTLPLQTPSRAGGMYSGPDPAPPTTDITRPSSAADIIRSYLVSLEYKATGLTFDLRLEAEVRAKLTSWSLGIENDPRSLVAVRGSVGIADVSNR